MVAGKRSDGTVGRRQQQMVNHKNQRQMDDGEKSEYMVEIIANMKKRKKKGTQGKQAQCQRVRNGGETGEEKILLEGSVQNTGVKDRQQALV